MTNIVMLVRDRYILTRQALDSLWEHTNYDDYTLTVVDDGSTDFRVRHFTPDLYVERSSHTLSQLKNLCIYWSEQHFGRGDWLYISDNDVYFANGWLSDLIRTAKLTERDGFNLWGGQHHPYHKPIDSWISSVGMLCATEHDCLAGTSWLMRWSTWDKYGPFKRDTAPGVCQSEDYEFTQRLRADGGRIGVIHPHVVIHTGITNSEGKPAVGSDLFPRVPGVIYE